VPDARRVLLIEDDRDTREGLSELIRTWGFAVDSIEDADQPLEVLLRRRPDIIIADLSLRVGDPCDFIARVRAECPGALIVVYSGRHGLDSAAREAGADAFVLKPDMDTLERLLQVPEGGSKAKSGRQNRST
jgi:DNA-binding response OmpR family regulator